MNVAATCQAKLVTLPSGSRAWLRRPPDRVSSIVVSKDFSKSLRRAAGVFLTLGTEAEATYPNEARMLRIAAAFADPLASTSELHGRDEINVHELHARDLDFLDVWIDEGG